MLQLIIVFLSLTHSVTKAFGAPDCLAILSDLFQQSTGRMQLSCNDSKKFLAERKRIFSEMLEKGELNEKTLVDAKKAFDLLLNGYNTARNSPLDLTNAMLDDIDKAIQALGFKGKTYIDIVIDVESLISAVPIYNNPASSAIALRSYIMKAFKEAGRDPEFIPDGRWAFIPGALKVRRTKTDPPITVTKENLKTLPKQVAWLAADWASTNLEELTHALECEIMRAFGSATPFRLTSDEYPQFVEELKSEGFRKFIGIADANPIVAPRYNTTPALLRKKDLDGLQNVEYKIVRGTPRWSIPTEVELAPFVFWSGFSCGANCEPSIVDLVNVSQYYGRYLRALVALYRGESFAGFSGEKLAKILARIRQSIWPD